MSELEFLGALEVELLRHAELRGPDAPHELFQTSTIKALLEGAYDGDTTLAELLEHGDLGLGTFNGLDGELIVLDGQALRADVDTKLAPADLTRRTPYAVVVPFAPAEPVALRGPIDESELEDHLVELIGAERPTAIRIDGRFQRVRMRSVPGQRPPYRPFAEVIADEHISELHEVAGTLVGFSFPDALDGIEMLGWHLHFASEDRRRGGHVLAYSLLEGIALLDLATLLHVELPPAVGVPEPGAQVDQQRLRRLERDG